MQRIGRTANIASKPSNERNSACLNLTELQRGHFRRIQSICGTQSGQIRIELLILFAPFNSPDGLGNTCDFSARICVQPCQQTTYASGRQRNAGVCCSVVEMNRISILANGLPAREHDVFHISVAFI